MKTWSVILFILIWLASPGCRNDSQYSDVINLSEFEKTQFIPTLEHKIPSQKNSVYCATLLFAWDQIRDQIKSPLTISDEHYDLKQLNQSNSFIDVLKSHEYTAKGQVNGDLITATAEFKKSLPFEFKLQNFQKKLTFNGQKVASFGLNGYDSYEKLQIVKIIYYQDDNNLIISLSPKDKAHEVILFMTEKHFGSMAEMAKEIALLAEIGLAARSDDRTNWRYRVNDADVVIIPKFKFNIETNYSTLEGSDFTAGNQHFRIEQAWQRTAFTLDETGAEIESEAAMAAATEMNEEFEKPKPKKMIFDKPFLLLLKRTDANNPYFGLWIANSELMVKE